MLRIRHRYELGLIAVIVLISWIARRDLNHLILAQDGPTATPNINWVNIPEGVNVRSGPGFKYDVNGVLPVGAWVQPLARTTDGEWILITYLTTQGWIQVSGVSWRLNTAALPVIDNLDPTPIPRPLYYNTPGGPTSTPNANWVDTDTDGAYIRSGPGQGYPPLGVVLTGDVVDPVAHDQALDWVMVRYSNGYGWIRYDLVAWVEDVDQLPVIDVPDLTPSFTPVPIKPTVDPNLTLTATPAASLTATLEPLPSPVPTLTFTGTFTATAAATETPSPTPSETLTQTATASATQMPSATPTATVTLAPTSTVTETPTFAPSATPTETPTDTPTVTPASSVTPLPSATKTATTTHTASPTSTDTATTIPTFTPFPTETSSPVPTFTPLPALPEALPAIATWTPLPSATETPSPTPFPTASETTTVTATWTPLPSPTGTSSPTPFPTATETATVTAIWTPIPTATGTPSPTPFPTATETATVMATWTPLPSATETPAPSPSETATTAHTATPLAVALGNGTNGTTGSGSDTPPSTTESQGTSLPPILLGGGLALVALVYISVYVVQAANVARYREGFVLSICPVCLDGDLHVEDRRHRVLGIPRVRRVVRCDICRSVLRQVGPQRWRYAVDGAENPELYQEFNGRTISEQQLIAISPEYQGQSPEFVEGDDTP